MLRAREQIQIFSTSPVGVNEAIEHLKRSIASGKHWYIALLEAIGLWPLAEETRNGRKYCYLIDNEAFDWLLLAERLCEEVDSLIPEPERLDLLFFSKPPIEVSKEEFRHLIGDTKYRAYLNYFYGITVEEVLVIAIEEEIRKEQRARGYNRDRRVIDDAYRRIYGASQLTLLRHFRIEKGYPQKASTSLTELREFVYWRFKYRLKRCDRARVASDTKKGLNKLQSQRLAKALLAEYSGEQPADVIEMFANRVM